MEGYYYTYILQSEKNGKNYAGYTKDLNLRFEQHQNGEVKATKYWRHAQRVFHRVDESVLMLLSKRKPQVKATIFTGKINQQLRVDIEKFNAQYAKIEFKHFNKSHDRFLIIDEQSVYHIGASLKDLGKKWFAFSKIDINPKEMISKLEKA